MTSPTSQTMPVPSGIKDMIDPGPAPVFGTAAKKPKAKSTEASFLSGSALPSPGSSPGKTLTGQ